MQFTNILMPSIRSLNTRPTPTFFPFTKSTFVNCEAWANKPASIKAVDVPFIHERSNCNYLQRSTHCVRPLIYKYFYLLFHWILFFKLLSQEIYVWKINIKIRKYSISLYYFLGDCRQLCIFPWLAVNENLSYI